jgi:Ca2+-binding RTX toxin-like protein
MVLLISSLNPADAATIGNCASVPSAFSGVITATTCSSVCNEVSAGTVACNLKLQCDATSGATGWLVSGAGAGAGSDYLFVGICDGGTTEFCCEIDDDSPSTITEMGITGTEVRDYLFLSDDDLGVNLEPTTPSPPTCGARGEEGDDFVVGSDEDSTCLDLLNGGPGEDDIRGREGADQINGHSGVDFLFGNDDSAATGDDGNDVIRGGDDDDYMYGWRNDDMLFGEAGDDMLCGANYTPASSGGPPTLNDIFSRGISSGLKPTTYLYIAECVYLATADGDDDLVGGAGNDTINGGYQDDRINGGEGNDTIDGDKGDDRIVTEKGDDIVNGGDNSDIICAVDKATVNDVLNGGNGNDEIYSDESSANVTIDGGPGTDVCYPAGLNCTTLMYPAPTTCPLTTNADGTVNP